MRCGPKQGGVCCDLHNPAAFVFLDVPVVKPARQPASSSIPAYQVTETDQMLRLDLEDWRCSETKKVYGKAHLRNLGPGLVMGETVCERIVDCAHFSKIRTIADLEKETKWFGSSELSKAVMDIIRKHYPLPVSAPLPLATPFEPPTTQSPVTSAMPCANPMLPLSQMAQNSVPSQAKVPRKRPKCSLCHEEGHTSAFISHYFAT